MSEPASRDVTFVARARGEGHVDAGLEELRVLRRMRVVALPTVHRRRRDVQVGLAERRPVGVVALEARGLDRLTQQGILGRKMRLVAAQAVSGCWQLWQKI